MLDIIAALRWVQENIAQGLFHKAIVEFDVLIKGLPREKVAATTTEILRKLGIKDPVGDQLSKMPAAQLLEAAKGQTFVPVVAGSSLPRDPFFPDAPDVSSQVPLLLGNNRTEGAYWILSGGTLISGMK
jgi:para-nitrobenzyl esterase